MTGGRVYVLEQGEYSDRRVVAVFSSCVTLFDYLGREVVLFQSDSPLGPWHFQKDTGDPLTEEWFRVTRWEVDRAPKEPHHPRAPGLP